MNCSQGDDNTAAAFGFLTSNPAGIALSGVALTVPDGATFDATAGSISLDNTTITALEGAIRLDALASSGTGACRFGSPAWARHAAMLRR